jgi:hypothetical protein
VEGECVTTQYHALGNLLAVLHDRGLVNEDGVTQVFAELFENKPLTLDHLVHIFGVAPVYHLLTVHDETARQLVREARDLFVNPDTSVNLRDWIKAAEQVVGPVASIQREPVRDA